MGEVTRIQSQEMTEELIFSGADVIKALSRLTPEVHHRFIRDSPSLFCLPRVNDGARPEVQQKPWKQVQLFALQETSTAAAVQLHRLKSLEASLLMWNISTNPLSVASVDAAAQLCRRWETP